MSEELSRALAKILRHDKSRCSRLGMTEDGYVDVEDLLDELSLSHYSESDVRNVVASDRKGRFKTRMQFGKLQIKATQGHTFELAALDLELIDHHTQARSVLHATTRARWENIKVQGLNKMRREYIHFAPSERAQSGFPAKTDTVIEIDLPRAMRGGLKFYKSENGVILSKGNMNGVINPEFFKRAYDRQTGEQIWP